MHLSQEERGMLDGDQGPMVQKSMALLVKVGEAYGAERMIPVSHVHLIAWELSDTLFDLFASMTKEAKVRVPTTVNPLLFNLERAKELGIPQAALPELRRILSRLAQAHQNMGVIPTYTCHPHFMYELRLGEHIALTESNVVMFASAWYGARSNIEGGTTAIASALTGRTPEYGLHITGNRYGEVLIDVARNAEPEKFEYADYSALAHWAGKVVVDRIPVYQGLSPKTTASHAKYMCAPLILESCVAMFHIAGVTPEAPTLEAAFGGARPKEKFAVGRKEMASAFEELCSAKEQKVDLVCFGCPHCTLQEIADIARLLEGKKVSANVRLWIGTNEPSATLARRMGLVDIIERAGGLVLTGMCAGSGPALRMGAALGIKTVATTSATLAGIAPGRTRGALGAWFGRTSDCIAAAISGKWEGR